MVCVSLCLWFRLLCPVERNRTSPLCVTQIFTEVQQTRQLLFQLAQRARPVTQTPFGSLGFRVYLETWFGICVTDLAIGAPHEGVLNLPND